MGFTVKKSFSITGKGIHSGEKTKLTFNPYSKPGFLLLDKKSGAKIHLKVSNIKAQSLGTNIVTKNFTLKTIEHLFASLWFLKITDLIIEIDGQETPILDGSCIPFIETFQKAGLKKTKSPEKILKITEPIQLYDKDKFLIAMPDNKLSINYTISFPQNPVKTQNLIFDRTNFLTEIAPARTFGNIEDLEKLKESGCANGASLDNVLAYNSEEFINEARFPTEPVAHKILDLVGDLYASGYLVKGKLVAYKTNHVLNNKFMKLLVRKFQG